MARKLQVGAGYVKYNTAYAGLEQKQNACQQREAAPPVNSAAPRAFRSAPFRRLRFRRSRVASRAADGLARRSINGPNRPAKPFRQSTPPRRGDDDSGEGAAKNFSVEPYARPVARSPRARHRTAVTGGKRHEASMRIAKRVARLRGGKRVDVRAGLRPSGRAGSRRRQLTPGPDKPNILFIMDDDIGWMQPSIYHRGLMVGGNAQH